MLKKNCFLGDSGGLFFRLFLEKKLRKFPKQFRDMLVNETCWYSEKWHLKNLISNCCVEKKTVFWTIQEAYFFDFFWKKVKKISQKIENFGKDTKSAFSAFLGHFFQNFGIFFKKTAPFRSGGRKPL